MADTTAREAVSTRGRVAAVFVRTHAWVLRHWPTSVRRRLAVVVVIVAVAAVGASTAARLLGAAIDAGALAYVGLMVVCWVGAGGALVPVPGVRPLSWVMIVHQSTVLAPPIVIALAALAMVLGQSSYFVAVQVEERRRAEGRGPQLHRGRSVSAAGDVAGAGDAGAATGEPPNRVVARTRAMLDAGRAAVTKRMATHPQRILFLLCVVPNPLTTFATVSAASSNLPFGRFFAASLAGFLVLTTALAVAGQGILVALGIG